MKTKNKKTINREKLYKAAQLIIEALGEDSKREGLLRTPERVARDWPEMFDGYEKKLEDVLNRTFDAEGYDEMVIREEIEVNSFCEHHILPFRGYAWVGYIPNKRIIGLDKIDKLVKMYAHRLQNQERLTSQIAKALWNVLQPLGVMVVLKCKHDCMRLRGVRSKEGLTTTSACFGVFRDDAKTRQEFLDLINKRSDK